jgi:hypothetical protein
MRAQEALLNLTSALGIDVRHLSDDVLEIIALRIVVEDVLPTKPNVERIIAEVRAAEAGGQANVGSSPESTTEEPAPASAHRPYRFNATEATDAKYRHRLSLVHNAEDRRTALDIRPRRPDPLGPTAVHPPCKAAYQDGGACCSRCAPLLHDVDCTCPDCDYALGVQE